MWSASAEEGLARWPRWEISDCRSRILLLPLPLLLLLSERGTLLVIRLEGMSLFQALSVGMIRAVQLGLRLDLSVR